MRYLLMMHTPRGSGEYQHHSWSPDRWQAHLDYLVRLNTQLGELGELVGIEALTAPGQAKLVRARGEGMAADTDGPFAETKEFLAGFWIVDVERPERAYEIAAIASAAPGPDGAPLNMPIEVRQVMRGPADDV
jgi:hypothetical protein